MISRLQRSVAAGRRWRARCVGLVFLAGSLACSASVTEPGLSVDLDMLHQPDGDASVDAGVHAGGEARAFRNGDGHAFLVTRAMVVFASLEILPCPLPMTTRLWRSLLEVPTARAHGLSSPFALSEPQVVDLMATDLTARPLGTIEPPPGEYCGLRVVVGPADADGAGIDEAPDLVGESLVVAGEWRSVDADRVPEGFELRAADTEEVTVPFAHAAPVSLSLATPRPRLRVVLRYDAMFEGIDPDIHGGRLQAVLIQQNLLQGLAVIPCTDATCPPP